LRKKQELEEVKQKLKNQELIENKNPEHNQANKEIKTQSSWMPSAKTTLITLGIGGVSYAGYKFWKWRHNKNKKSYNK
jgi:short subunit fatty acids transporter